MWLRVIRDRRIDDLKRETVVCFYIYIIEYKVNIFLPVLFEKKESIQARGFRSTKPIKTM